jgi:hypothetical protein
MKQETKDLLYMIEVGYVIGFLLCGLLLIFSIFILSVYTSRDTIILISRSQISNYAMMLGFVLTAHVAIKMWLKHRTELATREWIY